MKKFFNGTIISVFLAVVIMLSSVIIAPAQVIAVSEAVSDSESETGNENDAVFNEADFGDVNSDKKINAADARLLLRCAAELENVTSYILLHGDFNADGKITSADARIALRLAAGLEDMECLLHGHEYKDSVIAPDCTNEGYTTGKCVRCNTTDGTRRNIVPAKGHTYEELRRKPSCTVEGWLIVRCTVCGFKSVSRKDGDALGHDLSDWVREGNVKKRTCSRCSYYESEKIKTDKVVYLTFDDGPGVYTERLLNCLRKYNVKATFFVTNQFPKYRYLLKTMAADGHAIGVHTLTHNWNIYSSESAYMKDFNSMHSIIKAETGIDTKIFRFPGGTNNTVSRSYRRGIMTTLANKMVNDGYYYFDWNVDCYDTSGYSASQIASTTIGQIKNRKESIVLMHDIKKATVDAVPTIIEYCLRNGYTFEVLDESSPAVRFRPAN